jgi:hypothetical protein
MDSVTFGNGVTVCFDLADRRPTSSSKLNITASDAADFTAAVDTNSISLASDAISVREALTFRPHSTTTGYNATSTDFTSSGTLTISAVLRNRHDRNRRGDR